MTTREYLCDCGIPVRVHKRGNNPMIFNVRHTDGGRFHACPPPEREPMPANFAQPGVTPTTGDTVKRNHQDRPYVGPGARDLKGPTYTRCTNYIGVLEDQMNLQKYFQRQVALGLGAVPELMKRAVKLTAEQKQAGDILCADARAAAGSGDKAARGTYLHGLSETLDRGEALPLHSMSHEDMADLQAYKIATAGMTHLHIEKLMVNDEHKVAGTPDRLSTLKIGNDTYVVDLKTGRIDFGIAKIAMQLAMYANSDLYDQDTDTRTPVAVNRRNAVVIHMPAGEGVATLHWVDIAAGWEGVQIARDVKAWRARKGLSRPFV